MQLHIGRSLLLVTIILLQLSSGSPSRRRHSSGRSSSSHGSGPLSGGQGKGMGSHEGHGQRVPAHGDQQGYGTQGGSTVTHGTSTSASFTEPKGSNRDELVTTYPRTGGSGGSTGSFQVDRTTVDPFAATTAGYTYKAKRYPRSTEEEGDEDEISREYIAVSDRDINGSHQEASGDGEHMSGDGEEPDDNSGTGNGKGNWLGPKCPCPVSSHCNRVLNRPRYEVFTFVVSKHNYLKYDWTKITTVILFAEGVQDYIMCYAHSKGVKVVFGADYPIDKLTDPSYRKYWVQKMVTYAQDHFFDGINLDFEGLIHKNQTDLREGLNKLVTLLNREFKRSLKGFPQVTFDGPPHRFGLRHYDWAHIANTSEFFLIMSYDIMGPRLTGANSGYHIAKFGVAEYHNLGIPYNKLVLGVSWYGYDYPCAEMLWGRKCKLHGNEGHQVSYRDVYNKFIRNATSQVFWDIASQSPYFNYIDAGTQMTRQIWCDNLTSLEMKYKWAVENKLRGIGMWHADHILYTDTEEGRKQQKQMWGALPPVNADFKYAP